MESGRGLAITLSPTQNGIEECDAVGFTSHREHFRPGGDSEKTPR